ncbi:MAG: sulfatase-like hydrolase/transferase [Phycisphaerales bacterium]|nr:sulfatase-like hydrolase/transferase [Phycisphaerales bacterium]
MMRLDCSTIARRFAVLLGLVPGILLLAGGTRPSEAGAPSDSPIVSRQRPVAGASGAGASAPAQTAAGSGPPNILVIVLDDIGIDQTGIPPFGWNASSLVPDMPVLASIAASGVSFTNFWAAPECSPTRAAMLTGRYGFRTGVVTAIIDPMLPVDQLNPAEITVPKILGPAGYRTAMIGKYHLAGSTAQNAPVGYRYEAPATTSGLDFYDGYWDLPPSIDTTIGGQVANGTYSCGGLGGLGTVGAACFPDGTCMENLNPFEAMAMGGTPLLDANGNLAATCADGTCAAIDFTKANAYYVWPRITTFADGSYLASDPSMPERNYLTSFISGRSTAWVNDPKAGDGPWLAYVTHSSSHTPIQPPPPSLSEPDPNAPDCSVGDGTPAYRLQFKRMCEAVDRSMGEMLADLGLGTIEDGVFSLTDPKLTNTMIVVFGDNGSFGLTVLPPFDPLLSKQTVYQTGVWTPCVVAGPMVNSPGRAVDEMVNAVDLFGLVADAAGVDWQAQIPSYRPIDSRPMLPYLTDPSAPSQRQFDYAIYGEGTFAPGQVGPCIIASQVVDGLITSPGLCSDNGGCWAGGADTPPYPVMDYCDLLAMGTFQCGDTTYCVSADDPFCTGSGSGCGGTCVTPPTVGQWAVRMGRWKLIVLTYPTCLAPNDCVVQFYKLAEPNPPFQPGLDLPEEQIDQSNMTDEEQAVFDLLRTELYNTLSSEWYCPGDGNKDFRIDSEDLQGLLDSWGGPGFWDLDESGVTDGRDLGELLANWNADCTGRLNPAGQNIPSCLEPAR